MSDKKRGACESCKYYDVIDYDEKTEQDFGFCLRFPPQLMPCATSQQFANLAREVSSFPTVVAADWCGEYKKLKKADQ